MCLIIGSAYHTLIRLAGVEFPSGLPESVGESDNAVARGVLGAHKCSRCVKLRCMQSGLVYVAYRGGKPFIMRGMQWFPYYRFHDLDF